MKKDDKVQNEWDTQLNRENHSCNKKQWVFDDPTQYKCGRVYEYSTIINIEHSTLEEMPPLNCL
jgi:hypothetical protein